MDERTILRDALAAPGCRCWAKVAGVRAGLAALKALGVPRPERIRLFVILDTGGEHRGTCFAAGVQHATGCTFEKGNVRGNPLGTLALTLIDRDGDRAVRVSCRPTLAPQIPAFMGDRAVGGRPDEIPEADRIDVVNLVWDAPETEVLAIGPVHRHPYTWQPDKGFTPCRQCRAQAAPDQQRVDTDRPVQPCSGLDC